MTLEEAKVQAYNLMQSHLQAMRDMVDDPSQLQTCGHKTLESFLKARVIFVCKETEKIFRQYEKDNP